MRSWCNGLLVGGLAAVLLTSLAGGCAFWRQAEPELPAERPAVSSAPAPTHSDAVPARSGSSAPVELRTRRTARAPAASAPDAAAAVEDAVAVAEEPAAEELAAEVGPVAPETAVTLAPAELPAVSEAAEDAAEPGPNLVLSFAAVVGFGLIGIWLSRRQTSA